jgi:hypothetical protein
MSMVATDSAEVIKFMALFARLKEWTDDSPSDLEGMGAIDPGVRDLCTQLSFAAYFLKVNERRARVLFAAPANPSFIAAWRDYEVRYEHIVSSFWLWDIFPAAPAGNQPHSPSADFQWDNADHDAREQAVGINAAITFAGEQADQDDRWDEQQQKWIEQILEGSAAWDRLRQEVGFDLRGVFRRRALVPFILVPRGIAARYGNAKAGSMLTTLQQAHDAFVFGTPLAALALMRSIMEAALRDHYRIEGKDLAERIKNARHKLPRGANEAALHRLRKRANAVLHNNLETDHELPIIDEVGLEKEIVSLLLVLRSLIEGAP